MQGRKLIVAGVCALYMLLGATAAYGWAEADVTYTGDPMDCVACHTEEFFFATRVGPHGNYATASTKCAVCHSVHTASAAGFSLLPGATVKDNCLVCHDGTGGMGVYGAIEARGLTVGASHSIDTTNVIPGGDVTTGGSATGEFGGVGGTLSCDDCHSPHGARVVDAFSGERIRFHASDLNWLDSWATSKLLKQRPTGSETTATVYGSDWCLGCHKARDNGGATHNHPVDSLSATATPFYYDNVAIMRSDTSTETTLGTLGLLGATPGNLPTAIWHNRGYVMPYPRSADQTGHAPICQQCHEDSRFVGSVGAVTPAGVERYGDGQTDGDVGIDNPLFQTFPHETQNYRMLVEATTTAYTDDLCLNCHPVGQLP